MIRVIAAVKWAQRRLGGLTHVDEYTDSSDDLVQFVRATVAEIERLREECNRLAAELNSAPAVDLEALRRP